nr:hypothetical protein [Micromonospora sp. DSM 115978]
MTGLSRSPRTTRGAIVGLDPANPLASVVVFQYNPDEMTRSLQARTPSDTGTGVPRTDALRLHGAPVESITLRVEIDAADQLAAGDSLAAGLGVYPQLSALEMLLYPKSAVVLRNTVLALAGTIEVVAPAAPLTLLVWGIKRVVPVRLTSFSLTEQAYDPDLNPIRARVDLGLQVLSYNDLTLDNPGRYVFLAHQVVKEAMATIGSASAIATVGSGLTGSLSAGV